MKAPRHAPVETKIIHLYTGILAVGVSKISSDVNKQSVSHWHDQSRNEVFSLTGLREGNASFNGWFALQRTSNAERRRFRWFLNKQWRCWWFITWNAISWHPCDFILMKHLSVTNHPYNGTGIWCRYYGDIMSVVIVVTTCDATSGDRVCIMTTLSFQ